MREFLRIGANVISRHQPSIPAIFITRSNARSVVIIGNSTPKISPAVRKAIIIDKNISVSRALDEDCSSPLIELAVAHICEGILLNDGIGVAYMDGTSILQGLDIREDAILYLEQLFIRYCSRGLYLGNS